MYNKANFFDVQKILIKNKCNYYVKTIDGKVCIIFSPIGTEDGLRYEFDENFSLKGIFGSGWRSRL